MKVFKNGLITGLIFQLAIGPVFFFIVNLTLQKTMLDGLAGVIGVTLADYFYIALAIIGVGKILENNKIKKAFGIVSSVVLILFGLTMLKGVANIQISANTIIDSANIFSSFLSVFLLTISSPLTIVFWTGVFAAKTIELNYSKKELFIFGLSTGLATFIFMSLSVILFSLIKQIVPIILIQLLNGLVGFLLVGYGILRLKKSLQ
ncbi:MAG: Lysine exporter protein (LYSE/YGGA) [Candidatus Roizmanbacteria bacterium GW2011_GWA2_35_19]|uniref:Lysine exporter protein (LYSE/YGGA) n=2 Tax=Candidatus Roizmaniibacteriota TaxID=1752723 RepID=A0A0G0F016_9BACT|nr:MAG: Lysine exporter protein (LYSE/YGGA) [Candidatus Roizmanbacteria bacterium GW2011_GWC2_35_12]KKP72697.1 MAG: Lysine exporter protein (LYSE/YGGA) [Candidatus Roizmanbacteria bacterium GW2011_GWA2_35_19]